MSPLPVTTETNPSIPQSDAPPKVEVSDDKTSQSTKRPPVPQLDGLPQATKDELARLEKLFELSDVKLRAIVDQFKADFKVGLGKYGEGMAMIPTFVTGVPNGTEEGTFLALDLGGTNLRVCEVTLKGNHEFSLRQRKYKVSTALKTGEATALFDYMAESVDHFLTEREPTEQVGDLYLGLTFSFPVEQQALDSGLLLTWTKGFSATGAIGKDIVQLLQDAFDRKHLKVKCNALINDTVGALMCHGYSTGNCLLGAIFGTGTNGAFMERIDKIEKLQGKLTADHANFDQMIVNTEWGAFDNARRVLPVTQFDNKVDRESINPRFQLFEKFISGMYQGEICRNLLVNLIDNNILFNGHSTAQLNSHYGLDTSIMSAIETPATDVFDDTGSGALTPHKEPPHSLTSSSVLPRITEATLNDLGPPKASHIAHDPIHPNSSCQAIQTRKILVEELGFDVETISDNDAEIVLWACKTVATRAARLSACAVAAVVEQTSNTDNGADVGVDGSMVEFYPFFEERVRQALDGLLGEEAQKKVKIGLAKDGSGVGAALGALMAKKMADAVAAK